MPESVIRAGDINMNTTLSMLLYGYIKQQFNNVEDDELVAEDVPPEASSSAAADNLTDTAGAPSLGKSKKEKEKALQKGELHDHLWV